MVAVQAMGLTDNYLGAFTRFENRRLRNAVLLQQATCWRKGLFGFLEVPSIQFTTAEEFPDISGEFCFNVEQMDLYRRVFHKFGNHLAYCEQRAGRSINWNQDSFHVSFSTGRFYKSCLKQSISCRIAAVSIFRILNILVVSLAQLRLFLGSLAHSHAAGQLLDAPTLSMPITLLRISTSMRHRL